MWRDLLLALGLVLTVEGLLLAAFPHMIERAALAMAALPRDLRRIGGVLALAAGVLLVWLARG